MEYLILLAMNIYSLWELLLHRESKMIEWAHTGSRNSCRMGLTREHPFISDFVFHHHDNAQCFPWVGLATWNLHSSCTAFLTNQWWFSMRSARVIFPQFPVSSRSNCLHTCKISISEIFPIALSLYITNSDLLPDNIKGKRNQDKDYHRFYWHNWKNMQKDSSHLNAIKAECLRLKT